MTIHSNNFELMDQLLKEARQEGPLLNSNEVENVIRSGHSNAHSGPKGFSRHLRVSTLLVAAGLMFISVLAYTFIKPAKKDIVFNEATTNSAKTVTASETLAPVTKPLTVANAGNNSDKKVPSETAAIEISKPMPVMENKRSAEKKATKAESDLSVNISSVKISESFNMVSHKGNASGADAEKETMSKEVALSFNYNREKVKMKFAGDDLKELAIDNQPVASTDFKDHARLISEARKLIHNKDNSAQAIKRSADDEATNLNLVKIFSSELVNDHIVADGSPYSFELTSSQLLINNAAQSDEQFHKYKTLYESKTGKALNAGSEYAFEKSGKKN